MKYKIFIIPFIILIIFTFSLYYFVNTENAKAELAKKILDYEILSYSIITKTIKTVQVEEPYNCYIVNNDYSPITKVNAVSKSKSPTKPSIAPKITPKTTPKSNISPSPPLRSNNKSKNPDGSYDYDQDKSPVNPTNLAPQGKKWRCMYRTINKYDYVMTDSDKQEYIFATRQDSGNLIPEEWNNYQVGSPIAKKKQYENYFLAGTDPIFSPIRSQKLFYQDKIISEPVPYGKFNNLINQVQQTDNQLNNDELKVMNNQLMEVNTWLNNQDNQKQINLQIVIANEDMDDYLRELCIARDGCNKNDLILMVQLDQDKIIKRVQGYCWSTTGFDIAIELDSQLTSQKIKFNPTQFLDISKNLIVKKYIRKEMSEFKYIKEELIRQNQKKYNN